MKTDFTPEQLRDPAIRRSNDILRACVHCGFCTATCPSYQVLGDELDSPRGRIYLIKDMLENDRPADAETVKHIDRCLGCLACMTTCPSGVDYAHLLDHARQHIETTYKRPWHDRALRWILAHVLPYPARLRHALRAAKVVRPLGRYLPDPRARAMLAMVPDHIAGPAPHDAPQIHRAERPARARVALMTGCAQKTLNPEINAATIRLLTRLGVDVVVAKGTGCCGALVHHMGRTRQSHDFARQNIRAWGAEIDGQGLDAIVINTSGCGTTVKDYGDMLGDTEMAGQARAVSDRAMDICEFLARLDLAPVAAPQDLRVTYHAACSLQHGQKITQAPMRLLTQAGFTLATPADAHLCCGSAGTYNLLQPAIADQLKVRKLDTLRATRPDVIAAGNIGCMTQIGADAGVPVVHTVQLLDWAYGGPRPAALGAGPPQKPH